MAQYPTLAQLAYPDDPCPAYDELSDSTSDDDDCGANVMEGFMYDDHGELVPATGDGSALPVICTTPPTEVPPTCEIPRPLITPTPQAICGKRDVVVERDGRGKLGVKFTRMGVRMLFSFVEVSSSAAKCGLGFGDQLIAIDGIDFSRMSGTRLMSVLARSPAKQFKFTVFMRPFDFVLDGLVTPQMDLHYSTRQGKALGSVKVHRVVKFGHIKSLKLLCIGDVQVFGMRDGAMMSIFQLMVGQKIALRVMPRQVYAYLTRRQNKEKLPYSLQLSPRIL